MANKIYKDLDKADYDDIVSNVSDGFEQLLAVVGVTKFYNIAKRMYQVYTAFQITAFFGSVTVIFKDYLSEAFDEVIESLDFEELKHTAGRAAARDLKRQLKNRYDIDFEIEDLYSPTIAEEFGQFFAHLLNERINIALDRQGEIFSTLIPYDNIVPELDALLVEELELKLEINITSVLQNPTLLNDIKTQIAEKLITEFYNAMESAKLEAMARLKAQFNNNQIEGYKKAIEALDYLLPSLQSTIIAGINKRIPIFAQIKFTPRLDKIKNKLRQARYRLTHREQRIWVEK